MIASPWTAGVTHLRHFLSVDDLPDELVANTVTAAKAAVEAGRPTLDPALKPLAHRIVGTLFLTSSTRTRVGFEAAALRLGARTIAVTEMRFDAKMSGAESFEDALRVLTGMVDALVIRGDVSLDRGLVEQWAVCPVINGGDLSEHPSQALIDVVAIEAYAGPLGSQRIALLGDLTMRASRSLIRLFDRIPPSELLLCAPPQRRIELPARVGEIARIVDRDEIADVDVVLVTGLAPGRGADPLSAEVRGRYAMDGELMRRLPDHAVVLSPMPVIDEITDEARRDPRLRMFEQSDLGVLVRGAVLAHVLAG